MVDYLKSLIADFIIKKKLNETQKTQMSFSNTFKSSFRFFVVMPSDEKDFKNAFIVLDFLESYNKNVTVFTNDFRVALLPIKFRNKSLSYSLNQINKLKLPSNDLKNKLKSIECDFVIDLNREKNLFASYVTNLIKSKVRLGIEKRDSYLYYNLIFSDSNSESKIFFLNFLRMF